jgi:carbonic anhydrase
MTSRRSFLRLTGAVSGAAAVGGWLTACSPATRAWDKARAPLAGPTPTLRGPAVIHGESALQRLLNGNLRYVANYLQSPGQHAERRTQVAEGQNPFAAILCCADSRVPPEIIFDQGLGDLFVVRVAGNVVDDEILGSLEYAVEHLGVKLILVLGHERCGAVRAALESRVTGGHADGNLGRLIHSLQPAIDAADVTVGNVWDVVINANAQLTAQTLAKTGPFLHEAVKKGELQVTAARYDLNTGLVSLLKDEVLAHGHNDLTETEPQSTPEPLAQNHDLGAGPDSTPTAPTDHSDPLAGGHTP